MRRSSSVFVVSSSDISWCLADGYRNGDHQHCDEPVWLGKDFTFTFLTICYNSRHGRNSNVDVCN